MEGARNHSDFPSRTLFTAGRAGAGGFSLSECFGTVSILEVFSWRAEQLCGKWAPRPTMRLYVTRGVLADARDTHL